MTDSELVRFPLAGGGSVLVEVTEVPGVSRAGPTGRVLQEARDTFEQAVGGARDAAASALAQFTSMTRAPSLGGAKVRVEARRRGRRGDRAHQGLKGQFEVKLRWRRDNGPLEEEVVEEGD